VPADFQKEMAMLNRMLFVFAALALLLIPAAALAGPLFPMQLGGHYDYDGSDNLGHTWKCQLQVMASGISLNGQTYFHLRQVNGDPIDTNRHNPQDMLVRCTDTQAYISMGSSEALQFQTGPTSTPSWTTLDGQTALITSATSNITVPAGTFNPSFENKFTEGTNPSWYAYLYPNLGLVKQVDHWVAAGRDPAILALRATGTAPVSLFPMKTGMRLIFNVSDAKNNKWQMHMQILEQVSIGGKTYFHGCQTNYDLIGGNLKRDMYFRSTDKELYVSDGVNEHIHFQAAGPGTSWDFPASIGTQYMQITAITPINVLGGSYLAYAHDSHYEEPGFVSPHFIDYMVPGLGIAQMVDWWTEDPARAPLTFTLTKITQGGAGPSLNLLLLD